jgi:ubiquinone biosynthesis protein UbiJ
MRLTSEQRIAALERDNIVLHDTIKLLHKLLREQKQLINDYITQKVSSVENQQNSSKRPEDILYTFVCKQRFDRLEKQIEKLHKTTSDRRFGLKAG